MKTSLAVLPLTALLALGLSACGSTETEGTTGQKRGIEVFAAASLSGAGAELESAYEAENPGTDITFNYAGSSKLVQQMQEGVSPDLLITADTSTMDKAREKVADLQGVEPQIIASNALVLATSAGNPAGVEAVADLAQEGVVTAICAAEVPCGKLAHQELEIAGVEPATLTEEANVTAVATKVSTGEADAGFIYTTDAAALKKEGLDITVLDLPELERNSYPLALTRTGQQNEQASDFARWLEESEKAAGILTDFGFATA